MAAGNERAHATRLRQGQSPAVVELAGLNVVGVHGNVPQKVVDMRSEAMLCDRRMHRPLGKPLGVVAAVEQQGRATERVIGPGALPDDAACRLQVDELLAVFETLERLAAPT